MFTEQQQTTLAIIVFVYFLILMAIAFVINRQVKTYEDYSVAGRTVKPFPMILTLVGTAIGGSILLGYMTNGYVLGMGQIWLGLVIVVPSVLMAVFFLKRIRAVGAKHNMITIGDYTALRYGEKARLPTALSVLVAYCAITGMQFVAIATILNLTVDLDMTTGILISWVLLTVKTYFGGLKSVVFQDAIHGTIQTVGIFALFFTILVVAGGWDNISERAAAVGESAMLDPFNIGVVQLIVLFLTIGAYQFVRQDLWQRFWAAKSLKSLKVSFWIAIALQTVLCLVIVGIGVMARFGLQIEIDEPTQIYYAAAEAVFSFPLVVIMVIAVLATVISCADSFFLAGSASIVNDIVKPRLKDKQTPKMLMYSKLSVLITSVIACLLALYIPQLITLWIVGTAMLVSGILAPVLLGLLWSGVTRVAGVSAMWSGLAVAVGWQLMGQPFGVHPVLLGLPISIVVLVGVSLMTKDDSHVSAREEEEQLV